MLTCLLKEFSKIIILTSNNLCVKERKTLKEKNIIGKNGKLCKRIRW